jgi:hypothetical protein
MQLTLDQQETIPAPNMACAKKKSNDEVTLMNSPCASTSNNSIANRLAGTGGRVSSRIPPPSH